MSFLSLRPVGVILLLACCAALLSATPPVQFSFRIDHDPDAESPHSPFARDIWAEVETPDGDVLRLPAFYAGDDTWAVRTRAAAKGNYRFLRASEASADGLLSSLRVNLRSDARQRVRDTDTLGAAIHVDPRTGRDFLTGTGQLYLPLGGNLPWPEADGDPEEFYPTNLRRFADTGLNWTRIWMCHWGRLNLDWREPHHAESPPPGWFDLDVARHWDQIIAAADDTGVRLQMVLQHHGQYSSTVNSDWDANPWNTANGGWLDTPADFFTNARARAITRDKFRYIAARWGYSSSILAWELFNEVKWTDARRGDATANAAVADWHTEMARHLRRYDVHGHLITTSDDDLTHPLWAAMDYYQPHLYASNMVLGVQTLLHPPARLDRPVFFGEVGDDNMIGLTGEQRATGAAHVPIAWAGLFGTTTQPAQLWYIDTLRNNDRWDELAALAGFARAARVFTTRWGATTRPTVIGGDTVPWRIEPGYYWERGPAPELHLTGDGAEPTELMTFRRILTHANAEPAQPYPSRATFHFRSPAAANARLDIARVSNRGGSLRLTLDGEVIHDATWPAATVNTPVPSDISVPFRLGYGDHTLVLENPTGPDWVDLAGLDLGIDVPALLATARHAPGRSILWVRHRTQLLSPTPDDELEPTTATVQLTDYPAGTWLITWWDPTTGQTAGSTTITHRQGALAIDTPPITRHAAAWIERVE